MAALAYPDRIGLRRPGDPSADHVRYVLSGGKGATIASTDPLSRSALIVASDLDGDPREARIRQGAPLDEASLRAMFGAQIQKVETVEWSRRDGRVVAWREERFGALTLSRTPLPSPAPEAVANAAFDGLRDVGLPWSDAALRLRARIELLRHAGSDLPDCSDEGLMADGAWALPHLVACRTLADLKALDLTSLLLERIGWSGRTLLDNLAPAQLTTPLGRAVQIDYSGDLPSVSLRLQEVFGLTTHPVIGPNRTPLRMTLLSPAGRPIQVTTDLPGFWASSYAEVRKDMRGQYPKHPWPEDPAAAEPTLRAKPRGPAR